MYSSKFWSFESRKLLVERARASGRDIYKGCNKTCVVGDAKVGHRGGKTPDQHPSHLDTVYTHTRINFPPSEATRVLLPTISEGNTISSSICSCTAVRVRERGRFCLAEAAEAFRLGLGRTRRWERKTMYLSESFFSSSRVSLWREDPEGVME